MFIEYSCNYLYPTPCYYSTCIITTSMTVSIKSPFYRLIIAIDNLIWKSYALFYCPMFVKASLLFLCEFPLRRVEHYIHFYQQLRKLHRYSSLVFTLLLSELNMVNIKTPGHFNKTTTRQTFKLSLILLLWWWLYICINL